MWERASAISSGEDQEALQHQSEGQRHHCWSVSHLRKLLKKDSNTQNPTARMEQLMMVADVLIDFAGFSLCSAGWQLFYAEIWVVGFLPAPGHVLDKVRQVSIETWGDLKTGEEW